MHRFLPALFRSHGCEVIAIGVNHRARRYGRSKYGVFDRLWVGIADLAGGGVAAAARLPRRRQGDRPMTTTELIWLGTGLTGQGLFSLRFIVQWYRSERLGRSVIPVQFWYFSVAGGLTLLAYAIYKRDPVFIVGQLSGLFIYARNLYFIHREHHAVVPGYSQLPRSG
jgi:lipid-A-disaccharide synthase-like uncharacterized protein